ncbi:hypothetical protein G9A89_001176 [Geosiphon pyriformis]|nr:hypothetical protein G9A89_001176 [Geosiphon pyriformis]
MHPQTLQNAVTNARDFKSAELEANHAQVVNLVMNKLFDLDSKLKQLTPLYQPAAPVIYQPQPQVIYQQPPVQTLPSNSAQIILGNPRSKVIQNWRLAMVAELIELPVQE